MRKNLAIRGYSTNSLHRKNEINSSALLEKTGKHVALIIEKIFQKILNKAPIFRLFQKGFEEYRVSEV